MSPTSGNSTDGECKEPRRHESLDGDNGNPSGEEARIRTDESRWNRVSEDGGHRSVGVRDLPVDLHGSNILRRSTALRRARERERNGRYGKTECNIREDGGGEPRSVGAATHPDIGQQDGDPSNGGSLEEKRIVRLRSTGATAFP